MLQSEFFSLNIGLLSISVKDLCDMRDGTLIVGRTRVDRVHHLYLKNGLLNRIIYNPNDIKDFSYYNSDTMSPSFMLPTENGVVFPQYCDFEFCRQLRIRNIDIPFETGLVFSSAATTYSRFHAPTNEDCYEAKHGDGIQAMPDLVLNKFW